MDFGSINMDCARLRLISMDFASPHEKGRKRPTPAQYSLLSSLLKSRLNAAEEVNHANHEQDAIPVFGLLATLGVFVGKRRSTRGVSFVAALAAWLLQFYLACLRARRAITLAMCSRRRRRSSRTTFRLARRRRRSDRRRRRPA